MRGCATNSASSLSIVTSNCQRSSVSRVSLLMMASTSREISPVMSHATGEGGGRGGGRGGGGRWSQQTTNGRLLL